MRRIFTEGQANDMLAGNLYIYVQEKIGDINCPCEVSCEGEGAIIFPIAEGTYKEITLPTPIVWVESRERGGVFCFLYEADLWLDEFRSLSQIFGQEESPKVARFYDSQRKLIAKKIAEEATPETARQSFWGKIFSFCGGI